MSGNIPSYKIYGLSSTRNDIIRYIGYTGSPGNKRLYDHKKHAKLKRNHKEKWISKEINDGFNIVSEDLENCTSFEDALSKEVHYIKLFKSFGAKLTNSTTRGEGSKGYKHSEEQKKQNSIMKSKKIYYFDFNTGELLGSFPSFGTMITEMKFTKSCVRYVLMGIKRHYRWYTFSYTPVCPERREKRRRGKESYINQSFGHSIKPVKLEKEGSILEFERLKDALKFLNVTPITLYKYAKLNKPINGYKIIYNARKLTRIGFNNSTSQ